MAGGTILPVAVASNKQGYLDSDKLRAVVRSENATLETPQTADGDGEAKGRRGRIRRHKTRRLQEFLRDHGFGDVCEPQTTTSCLFVVRARVYPIHQAALMGDPELVHLLLQAKADPLQKTSRGYTAADVAKAADRSGSHRQVMELLQSQVHCVNLREAWDIMQVSDNALQ